MTEEQRQKITNNGLAMRAPTTTKSQEARHHVQNNKQLANTKKFNETNVAPRLPLQFRATLYSSESLRPLFAAMRRTYCKRENTNMNGGEKEVGSIIIFGEKPKGETKREPEKPAHYHPYTSSCGISTTLERSDDDKTSSRANQNPPWQGAEVIITTQRNKNYNPSRFCLRLLNCTTATNVIV